MATSFESVSATSNEARQGAQAYLNQRLANGSGKPYSTASTVSEIDISPSFSESLTDRKAVAAKIREACTTTGFFKITGHGVSEKSRKAVLELAQRFFKTLPSEKKQALHVRHSKYFRGYESPEFTYTNPEDWNSAEQIPETKEGFNWGYEAGLDPTGGDGKYTELDGEAVNGNVWPSEEDIPGFYAAIREYYGEILGLARHLFRLFALSLDLPEDHFDAMITHPGGIARLLYYPSPSDPQPLVQGLRDKEIGLGAHTDYECFTILLCSSTPGLEILSPENRWISAPPVNDGLIVNVADFLMRWTNGLYKSTIHRVVNRTGEERYSVPFFFSINYDQMVEVRLIECLVVYLELLTAAV